MLQVFLDYFDSKSAIVIIIISSTLLYYLDDSIILFSYSMISYFQLLPFSKNHCQINNNNNRQFIDP